MRSADYAAHSGGRADVGTGPYEKAGGERNHRTTAQIGTRFRADIKPVPTGRPQAGPQGRILYPTAPNAASPGVPIPLLPSSLFPFPSLYHASPGGVKKISELGNSPLLFLSDARIIFDKGISINIYDI